MKFIIQLICTTTIIFGLLTESCTASLQEKQFPVDTLANETAKFLLGSETKLFAERQKLPKYLEHKKIMKAGLNIAKPGLKKIKTWLSDKNDLKDSALHCLFYPFSGPDFLYADVFFPDKEKYILFGLEKIGKLPDFKNFSDTLLFGYLENLRNSLQYANNNGYFVTRQMNEFFTNENLDGTIHLLYSYLAQTSHTISSSRFVVVDFNGNISTDYGFSDQSKQTKGVEIQFFKPGDKQLKTLYYFKVDVSDFQLNLHPEFISFLNQQNNISTYLKSASYLLQYPEFSILKNYILKHSEVILQDDSGVKYSELKTNFDVKLYGKYSRTIKQFSERFQPDLKKDCDSLGQNLPFLLGYNKWHNESILMSATVKKETDSEKNKVVSNKTKTINTKHANSVRFKVQIGTIENRRNKEKYLKVFPDAEIYTDNGMLKLTVGNEIQYENCLQIKQEARKKGFTDAFIVAFENGKRIPVETALERSKNQN